MIRSSNPFYLLLFHVCFPLLVGVLFRGLRFVLSNSRAGLLYLVRYYLPFGIQIKVFRVIIITVPIEFYRIFSGLTILSQDYFRANVYTNLIRDGQIGTYGRSSVEGS